MAKERNKGDLQSLPECVRDFIKLVIRKMGYRRKVRAEVMDELTVHFEDELQSCKTDEEKEQKAKQSIEDFGDVKLLGVLLRRAKKRCRPLWRTVVARTFQTIGILILLFIAYTVWFLMGKPVVTVDYVAELNRIVRPMADESLNAALLYNKAAELCKEKSSDEISKLLGTEYNEATDEQKQLIEKWLTDNHQTLELVIAGSKKPYYWQKYETGEENTSEMMAVLLPHLAEFRGLAKALYWRAWLSAEKGLYEEAFDDTLACYKFGQHLRGDKFLIEQLIGMGLERLATQTLRGILNEREMNSAILAALQQDFEQLVADENFTVSFKFEKLAMYDEIQRCFTEDRLGGGHLYLRRIGSLAMGNYKLPADASLALHILFTHPNKQQTREMADRLYDCWETIADKSPAQLWTEGIDIQKEDMEIIKGNILLEILVPAIGAVIRIGHQTKVDIEAALTIIAILRYKQDTGDCPESLDDLVVAGYLKHLPMDPYSDKPLVYKKTDDNFILYSVGHNFEDDGGQVYRDEEGILRLWHNKFGDSVFWPVPK
jgi:hypothetical protein